MHMRSQSLNLAPEEQSGIEGGFDLQLGRTFTLGATRFDQTASGLIQRTTLPGDTAFAKGPRAMWENVGEIGNHGWELQARVERGPIALTGNLSLVDSRVRRLAAGYSGDLQAGDRMLAVPARTMGLTASVTQPDWFVSMTAYRASDWINYDRLGLAQAVVNASSGGTQLTGAQLRSFWQPYDGNTHLRLNMSRTLLHGVTALLTADNLLNYQRGEPDNSSVVPGRSISIGFRASF
jgi:iron complex outermembrane receptor protein